MWIEINFKNFEKAIIETTKKHKIKINCPKCKFYIWEYLLNELDKLWEVYCNNCDTLINFNVKF